MGFLAMVFVTSLFAVPPNEAVLARFCPEELR